MRERHNIVGTEVGLPRPPFYMKPGSRLKTKRPRALRFWALAALTLASIGIAAAACL